MRNKLLIVLSLATIGVAHADVYKWRDETGRWHYGDEPKPGSSQVELPPIQVYEPSKVDTAPPPAPPPRQEKAQASLSYSRAEVMSPAPEETIRNATGEVGVAIALEPSLRSGHRVRLLLDGAPAVEAVPSTAFTLANVNRGAHTVSAEILDAQGQVVNTTEPRTFYMHRPSRLQ